MERLFTKKDSLIRQTSMDIVRQKMHDINWDAPLIAIRGSRGVGKTTMMLQYIKKHYKAYSREVLYCTLDSVFFASNSLFDLADNFHKQGGKHLFLDEVHKYPTWSKEIKEIYDLYPDLRVVISGSSLLNILSGDADLSRRCRSYEMQGLSFREYLSFYHGIESPSYKLEEILEDNGMVCDSVLKSCHPLPLFQDYLKLGYYPFYLRHKQDYYILLEQVINFVIETELPQVEGVDVGAIRKIKSLLDVISNTVPYEVDATKLAALVEVHRTTIVNYINALGKAKLLNLLYSDMHSVKRLQKPDKIYMENTNLLYALAGEHAQIGTVRETFVVNQLMERHEVEYSKHKGDFRVDRKYTFEVGGESKGYKQIADISDSYILADDIEAPVGNKLPIWSIGLLY